MAMDSYLENVSAPQLRHVLRPEGPRKHSPGFSLGYPKKRVSPKGVKKSEQFLTAEAQNTRIPFCNS
ncbi:MAG: hypothetical protein QOI53_689 [Verrucomicrobiota bacterium]|nr:hypothetical protein [Verrucomicrobiota bacterium]